MPVTAAEFEHLKSLESPERRLENAHLKIGYFLKMLERYPLNNDIGACEDVGSAFLWHMEKDNLNIPDPLRYENIKDALPVQHQERMQRIWESVIDKRKKLTGGLSALKKHWSTASQYTASPQAESVIAEYGDKIPPQYKKALSVMIDSSFSDVNPSPEDSPSIGLFDLSDEIEQSSPADSWRKVDDGLRNTYFKHDKEYITTLRLYYQMLLETKRTEDPESGEVVIEETVLPSDHPARKEIWLRNRYLRLIDAIHQAVAIAKTLHHQQPTGRMRELEKMPYINHPIAVIGRFLKDVVPFVIDKPNNRFDAVLMAFILALHDLDEDTSQTVDQIIEKVKSIGEKVDSSLDHDGVIKSGFELDRDTVIARYITLLWPEDLELLEQSLKVISKSTPIEESNVSFALNQDRYFAPTDLSHILPSELTDHFTGEEKASGSNMVFKEFPPEPIEEGKLTGDDPKLDRVLFHLRTLARSDRHDQKRHEKKRRYPLMAKMLDRLHNLVTMEGMSYKNKRRYLRGTTSRLLAYAVMDHSNQKNPLYNVLPDLLAVTLREYKKFAKDFRANKHVLYTSKDDLYIAQLQKWIEQNPMQPLPDEWASVESEYRKERAKRKTPAELQDVTQNGVSDIFDDPYDVNGVTD